MKIHLLILPLVICFVCSCGQDQAPVPKADLVLKNAKVYSLNWPEPGLDGSASDNSPRRTGHWQPDAEALAIKDGLIQKVGRFNQVKHYIGPQTKVMDVKQAMVIPGLVDGHTHIAELGKQFHVVNLHGAKNPLDAINRVKAFIQKHPKKAGEWIVASGWDEGAWANAYPNADLLDKHFPNNPVMMDGAYGFAAWGNHAALKIAGIDRHTAAPVGGQILKDEQGEPTGIVMNRGVVLLRNAVPQPDHDTLKKYLQTGLQKMSEAGYVMIHHAGVKPTLLKAYMELADTKQLPIRVYAMLSGRDKEQLANWRAKGPFEHPHKHLFVRSVKGYFDGALGSRGAKMLEEYSDRPGHFGISGEDYGFFRQEIAAMIKAGFQVNIHAIGDAGNRQVLDFFEQNFKQNPIAQQNRHRIEHAQVVHADDFQRYFDLNIIASAQPPFVAEDKRWTVDRIGPERSKGAYAWRTFRQHGVPMVFGSDLTGYDFDIFYGLHSVITRRNKQLEPAEGWYPEQNLSAEEALLGYTRWAAYSAFMENKMGILKKGYWADITVLDTDVLQLGESNPDKLMKGKVLMTIVGGKVIYNSLKSF